MKVTLKMKTILTSIAIIFTACFIGVAQASPPRSCTLQEIYFLQNQERSKNSHDTTILASEISRDPGGPIVGLNIARITELGMEHKTPGTKGITEVSITNFLPDGQLISLQMVDSEKNSGLVERSIVGGTEKYRGAHGVFTRQPIKVDGKDYFKITFNVNVNC